MTGDQVGELMLIALGVDFHDPEKQAAEFAGARRRWFSSR